MRILPEPRQAFLVSRETAALLASVWNGVPRTVIFPAHDGQQCFVPSWTLME